ncbi:DUF2070 family protein [Thermoproteus tenax]|uniref:Conserved membrane protein n=1 Tax=Thermoproteus tenax (strain ATCC 35583 / DSM 2078 / JCM 9277 / NBRC 100435 / Kra 1) TaxID=768679 RepID=G4RL67_THETK|nr:DUF2070 family protein [Thermoproteus tenax]CCC82312.1 conserved membrane protein [Thermoproteus tenax Kra 1]
MSRVFEKAYSDLFREAPKLLSYILAVLILLAMVAKKAPVYLLAFAALYAFYFWTGHKVWSKVGVFQATSFSLGITALFDLLTQRPPLHYVLVAAVLASSVSMALRCDSKLYLIPIPAVSLYYFLQNDYALAGASLAYAMATPLVKTYLSSRVKGSDALCMLNSFLYSSVSVEGMFDHIFKPLGVKDTGKMHLYLMENNVDKYLVVVSEFHPGPFRGIGGGTLVERLVTRGLHEGLNVLFMHGVGGHERDPVSNEDVDKIVEGVFTAASSAEVRPVSEGYKPKKIEINDVKLTSFSLGIGPPLAIISRVRSASDDIPLEVAKRVETNGHVLVDAQNKFEGELRWTEEDVASLQEALLRASLDSCSHFAIGFGRHDTTYVDPLRLELGAGGIGAIISECDGIRSLLIIVDGNNIVSRLYEKIVEKYKGTFDVVEVVTTDTHASTRAGIGGGYKAVGSNIKHDDILKLIDRAVSSALRNMGKWRGTYRSVEVSVNVFGENFKRIRSLVESYRKLSIIMVIYLFVLPLAISLAL